jgi:hypothetical protein
MNKENLNKAIKCLSIREIRLNKSSIEVVDDFDPVFPSVGTLNVQFKSGFAGSAIRTAHNTETDTTENYLRCTYNCGYRVILPPEEGAELPKGVDLEGWIQVAEVTADFVAYYGMDSKLDQSAIDEFSKHNVGYHVWPYWREYASSIAVRLRLPTIMPPLYVMPDDVKKS